MAGDATYTFLFTDIVGSTRLWERHRAEMSRALDRHNAILRDAIDANGGRVFNVVGDAFHAVFASPSDAVAAAISAQKALSSQDWGLPNGLWVRMAVHTGYAEEKDKDFFGPAANLAARLCDVALGGQVILSDAAARAVRDALPGGATLQDLGESALKGIDTPVPIFRLNIPDLAVLTLERFQAQVGAVVVNCEPFRWPRNAWEMLELHVTPRSGPLHQNDAGTLEEYYNGAYGRVVRGLRGLIVQYVGDTGGPPVLVTDFRGHTDRFAFAPKNGLDLNEMRENPGYFTGIIRLVEVGR